MSHVASQHAGREMYEKRTKAQKIALQLGFKLRYLGGLEGNVGVIKAAQYREGFEILTAEEIEAIEYICQNARYRVKQEYNTARSLLPPSDGHRS